MQSLIDIKSKREYYILAVSGGKAEMKRVIVCVALAFICGEAIGMGFDTQDGDSWYQSPIHMPTFQLSPSWPDIWCQLDPDPWWQTDPGSQPKVSPAAPTVHGTQPTPTTKRATRKRSDHAVPDPQRLREQTGPNPEWQADPMIPGSSAERTESETQPTPTTGGARRKARQPRNAKYPQRLRELIVDLIGWMPDRHEWNQIIRIMRANGIQVPYIPGPVVTRLELLQPFLEEQEEEFLVALQDEHIREAICAMVWKMPVVPPEARSVGKGPVSKEITRQAGRELQNNERARVADMLFRELKLPRTNRTQKRHPAPLEQKLRESEEQLLALLAQPDMPEKVRDALVIPRKIPAQSGKPSETVKLLERVSGRSLKSAIGLTNIYNILHEFNPDLPELLPPQTLKSISLQIERQEEEIEEMHERGEVKRRLKYAKLHPLLCKKVLSPGEVETFTHDQRLKRAQEKQSAQGVHE